MTLRVGLCLQSYHGPVVLPPAQTLQHHTYTDKERLTGRDREIHILLSGLGVRCRL